MNIAYLMCTHDLFLEIDRALGSYSLNHCILSKNDDFLTYAQFQ
ncbi:hypothetical protein VIBNISO65_1280026 [Vibrio nigripulchritudo SO65]|nr:hypothetical protein VIBNISFn118_760057 [Vibrio nigripulchritudo SFn118]CCN75114.1 hypothetical protein VIBNISO65_1280026 [Vibrio nigripulchritudo SO65]CCN95605.1 hypothetical protein VIBNIENn2_60025 [Vibrio nigripulchritudo ENn2]